MNKKVILSLAIAGLLSGCQTTTAYIDAADRTQNVVAALSYADFNNAAVTMADEIIMSPATKLNRPGRAVLYVNEITNDTMQRIDTDQLVKSLRIKLLNSGKFTVTTAFGEDDATRKMRDLKKSEMVKKSTVKKNDKVIAPDFSLSGKILQRNASLDNGDTRIEYYFQLALTNIDTGLTHWEGERVVGKVADGKSVTW